MAKSVLGKLAGALTNRAPVPYVGKSGGGIDIAQRGTMSRTGQLESYGSLGTVFTIVNRLANTTAQIDWKLYRNAASGRPEDRTEVSVHPALVLLNEPNQFFTRQELFETVQQHIDLTGEGCIVVFRAGRVPVELWPVRPDRMAPAKDRNEFIVGWVYTDPDGKQVPLKREDVIFIRMPSPLDVYRGMGPVAAMGIDIETSRYAREWNRNFFRNSAQPGGIIEFPQELDDSTFERITQRWREQHRGVANAHRVAIIEEGGKWVTNAYSMRDMEFTALRDMSRAEIREAFGFPKPLLGDVDDVNRATAEAMDVIYGRWLLTPRLERWKGALNNDLLRLFNARGQLCFEYDKEAVVPADRVADNANMKASTDALVALVGAGFDPLAVCEYLDLPVELAASFSKPAPPPIQATAEVGRPAAIEARALPPYRMPAVLAAAEDVDGIDLSEVQDDWDEVLNQLMADWTTVQAEQRAAAVAAVQQAVADDDPEALAAIDLPWEEGAALLAAAMALIALKAARQVQREAGRQGVDPEEIKPVAAGQSAWREVARATARMLAQWLATAAGSEALRVRGTRSTPAEVADKVSAHLAELSDAYPRQTLGGALTGAQNKARLDTMRAGPVGALYASEQLDKNTCKNCRAVHGRWLGNTDDLSMVDQTYPQGAYGGYVDCLGGSRCRGTIVGVWRPKTTSGSGS